jgi:membrane associated rhomboid family serine protease
VGTSPAGWRFSGAKQGIAVWVWAIAIAVVVAVVGALLGSEFDVLARLDGFPRIPINEGDVTTGGIIAILAAAAAALIGAILGGLAGMRFHRKVDKAGLGH